MAKVKFGGLIAEIRNSINGWVFARNRGGAYIRTKVTPSNPQTQAQVQARARFAQFSQAWRSLTQEQRDAWSAAVENFSTTDVFGDTVNPSGSTLYLKLNCNITNAGGTAISVPPSPEGSSAVTSLELDADAGDSELLLTVSPSTVPAGHAMIIEASAPLSAGVSNANSKFRQIQLVAAAGTTSVNIWGDYVTKFGAPSAGQKVFVRAKFVRLNTGEKSQSLVANSIVE